ncbi:MAG: hypothetical protein V2J16_08030 [Thermoleophilia bacterium]|nr:hypothetical protein [Thermoleophilia bacterium]
MPGDAESAVAQLGHVVCGLVDQGEPTPSGLKAASAEIRETRQPAADEETEVPALRADGDRSPAAGRNVTAAGRNVTAAGRNVTAAGLLTRAHVCYSFPRPRRPDETERRMARGGP